MAGSPDLSEFKKFERKDQRLACQIKILTDDLPSAEQDKLTAACESEELPNRAVIGWLAAKGIKVSNAAVTSHRHRTCTCYAPKR